MICLKLVDRSFKVDPADHDIRSDTCQTPLTRMHKKKEERNLLSEKFGVDVLILLYFLRNFVYIKGVLLLDQYKNTES